MKRIKKFSITSSLIATLYLLSGCIKTLKDANGNVTPDPNTFTYKILIHPLENLFTFLAESLNWGYGWSIIILTLAVRIIILPLGINQFCKSMIQSEKMQLLKPKLDSFKEKLKKAVTPDEKLKVQMEIQKIYKENGLSIIKGIGCLSLLVQIPIFSALYFTVMYTPGINSSVFYGIDLGDKSIFLVIMSGIAYTIQSLISMIGTKNPQRKTMRNMVLVSPLMIILMSLDAPAGVTLYWVIGGFFGCLQSLITNVIIKPNIKEKMDQNISNELKITEPSNPKELLFSKPFKQKKRNEGKQKKQK